MHMQRHPPRGMKQGRVEKKASHRHLLRWRSVAASREKARDIDACIANRREATLCADQEQIFLRPTRGRYGEPFPRPKAAAPRKRKSRAESEAEWEGRSEHLSADEKIITATAANLASW